MKTKAKKFSHKLLALFMAILMAATCFSGAFTAFAATSSNTKYNDAEVEYNDLAWNVLSDEQLATAVLDFADSMLVQLKEMEPQLAKLVAGADIPVLSLNWDLNKRQVQAKVGFITLLTVTVKLGSVDELIETLESVQSALDGGLLSTAQSLGVDLGAIGQLEFGSVKGLRRGTSTSTDIVRGVLGIIWNNTDTLIKPLIEGTLSLGLLNDTLNVYQLVGDLLRGLGAPLDDGYQSNLVYNVVQSLIFGLTEWFTDEEIAAFKDGSVPFVFDEVLVEKLTSELLDKINVLVTYGQSYTDEETGKSIDDNSATRYKEIKAVMDAEGKTYAQAAASLGYDPNLIYSDAPESLDEDGNPRNVVLFAYGSPDAKGFATADTDKIALTVNDSLFAFGYQALKFAWNTVLDDTVKIIHVNYDVERGHGSNFDNVYYYYMDQQGLWTGDPAVDYSAANVEAWAEAVYADYKAADAEEFLGWVEHDLDFDRTVVKEAVGNYRDIDETTLFNKLRYSPLADYYFDMQTGPINLYFMQLGTPNLDAFFESYENDTYSSLVGGLNDALVAAVKDIFVESDNVFVNEKGDTSVPTMNQVNPATINDTSIKQIVNVLIGNALKVIQYTADTCDQNILNGFYINNGAGTALTEQNLEEAMMPLLIACIGQVQLSNKDKLEAMIHPEDFDKCKDAEALAYVCLAEYLSYVLPEKDYSVLVTDNGETITATLEGTILPMARDALIYVVEPYVPVTLNGQQWKAEDNTVDSTTTIFELFNNVACYYANYYTDWNVAARSGERALGVAPALGICDASGNSLFVPTNTLWQNIDIVANKFLPVLGTLQGYGYGNFNSEKLIWGDIVKGVLNIATPNAETGLGGVSNFLYRLLTIVSAEPIQTKPVISTVYDLVKDLLNAIFGARYSGQSSTKPVPDAAPGDVTPFDDILQKDTVSAILCGAIKNFVEFAGFKGKASLHQYPDTILPALTFAVSAVNSFVGFLPSIGDHNLQMASADFEKSVVSGVTSGSTTTTNVKLTNNSTGINIAYVDGATDSVNQMGRYYIQPVSATISGTNGSSTVTAPSTALLAPGQSATVQAKAIYTPDANDSSNYTVTFTYNVCEADGTVLYRNLKTDAYQYLTGAKNWEDVVYPAADRAYDKEGVQCTMLPEALEIKTANGSKTSNGYNSYSTGNVNGRLVLTYPEYMVLSTDNLAAINNFGCLVFCRNQAFGGAKGYDAIYTYDTTTNGKTVYDANGNVSTFQPNKDNAIPVINKITGDFLNVEKFDISLDGGETWDRGTQGTGSLNAETKNANGYNGYTQDEVNTRMSQQSNLDNFRTRPHVVFTFNEAKNGGIIAGYTMDDTGKFETMYMKANGTGNWRYDYTLMGLSLRGPIDGFYFNPFTQSVGNNKGLYTPILKYDGKTEIGYTNMDAKFNFYSTSGDQQFTIKFRVCDNSSADEVNNKVTELKNLVNQYQAEDFTSGQAMKDQATAALIKGLGAQALPMTPSTAETLSDKSEIRFNVATDTDEYGDRAYTLLTDADYAALTDEVKELLYKNNGIYYFDSKFTQPVYSPTPLAVTSATADAAGVPVTMLEDEEGRQIMYVANAPQAETEWVDTGIYAEYPIQLPTGAQNTDAKGNPLYDQIQWSYYNARGVKVTSTSTWVIKVPDTSAQLIQCTASEDNRGIYTRTMDLLDYTINAVYEDLSSSSSMLMTDISLVRNNLDENNFEIVTFNKMVDLAKTVEDQYKIVIEYTGEDGEEYKDVVPFGDYNGYVNNDKITIHNMNEDGTFPIETSLSSTQVAEYVRLFNFYMSKVYERGYMGNQLEAEIECASNNSYAALNATAAVVDEETGEITTPASVTKTATAATPAFGAWNADGELVNEGAVIYRADLWDNYVTALADAVVLAKHGNTDYAHDTAAYYVASDVENYDAQNTNCYTTDTALQVAEIALELTKVITIDVPEGATVTVDGEVYTAPLAVPERTSVLVETTVADGYAFVGYTVDDAEDVIAENPMYVKMDGATNVTVLVEAAAAGTFNVSADLVVATSSKGANNGTPVAGEYTITVYNDADEVAAEAVTTEGAMSVDLAPGSYTAVITSEYALDREVTINVTDADIVAEDAIAIICCNFNGDTVVAGNDALAVLAGAASGSEDLRLDLNGDTIVAGNDTLAVYTIAAGGDQLPAVVIE